ncbi:hypothetical protein LTR10_001391 [Elasticomyces elasticus]|nr:hypothetical protein LTR10_001391 [Elasticomyces elasticus]KAK4974892.1 Egl nine 1 [Elasticomyces elasticus]
MASKAEATAVRLVCGVCGKTGYLFRCGRCKHNHYCSKPCQAQDWPMHKMFCKELADPMSVFKGSQKKGLPPGMTEVTVKFPAICLLMDRDEPSQPANQNVHLSYQGSTMLGTETTSPPFAASRISEAIGFPLVATDGLEAHLCVQVPNTFAQDLFVDLDPKSTSFGNSTKSLVGAVLLHRRDGRHMMVVEIAAVIDYVRLVVEDLKQVRKRESTGEKVDRKEVIKTVATPAAFASWFEALKRQRLADGHKEWDIECPVQVGDEEAGKKDGA